jgi:hypothetical protein
MYPEASLNETEIGSQKRRLKETNGVYEVHGEPISNYKNYSLIHNSTIRIDGKDIPSFSVSVEPFDAENSCAKHLNFGWECKNFTSTELTLQLSFDEPECVSSSSKEPDILVVTFSD